MSDVLGSILFFSSNKANTTLSLSNVCYSATSFFVTMSTLLAKYLRIAKLKLVTVFLVVVVAVVPVLFFGEALLFYVTTNQEGGNNCFKMKERNLICVHHVYCYSLHLSCQNKLWLWSYYMPLVFGRLNKPHSFLAFTF